MYRPAEKPAEPAPRPAQKMLHQRLEGLFTEEPARQTSLFINAMINAIVITTIIRLRQNEHTTMKTNNYTTTTTTLLYYYITSSSSSSSSSSSTTTTANSNNHSRPAEKPPKARAEPAIELEVSGTLAHVEVQLANLQVPCARIN